MLLREGGGGSVEARLRMVELLHHDRFHPFPEAALGDEAAGKAARCQPILQPVAEPARDDDGPGPMGQRQVARDRPERQQKPVERGGGVADVDSWDYAREILRDLGFLALSAWLIVFPRSPVALGPGSRASSATAQPAMAE